MAKLKGSDVLGMVASWIGNYMYLPDPDIALVAALWCIGTHCFDRFYSYPYIAITASVKGAGKSTLMDIMSEICLNSKVGTAFTPAAMLRSLAQLDGKMSLFFDEAESTSTEAKSFMSQVLNSGYRKGQVITRILGGVAVDFPSYCPKVFALIGDPAGTVRDRSIVFILTRGNAPREVIPEILHDEASVLVDQIGKMIAQGSSQVDSLRPEFLANPRDREIWGSMFGLAKWLNVDADQHARLVRFAGRNSGLKTAPKRQSSSVEDEDKVIDDMFSKKALTDLAVIIRDGEDKISTADVVTRLQALPGSPWETFRGKGLDRMSLAALVSRYGLKSTACRFQKPERTVRGYHVRDIRKALTHLGENGK